MRLDPLKHLTVAAVLVGLAIAGCGESDQTETAQTATTTDRAQDGTGSTGAAAGSLSGTFVSTSDVQEEGTTAFSTPVTVTIADTHMSWTASCNGASVKGTEVTGDQLVVGDAEIASTMIGCPPKYQQQDEDLAAFFSSDPNWQLDGNTLTLSNDSVEVTLQPAQVLPDQ